VPARQKLAKDVSDAAHPDPRLFSPDRTVFALGAHKRTQDGHRDQQRSTIDVRENPGGYYLLIFIKAAFVCFAVAVLLNAFGLTGDPFIWMRQNLSFLMPR
jgi:hypothetical protein